MSDLKISENLFLGKQELNRWKKFLTDGGYNFLLRSRTDKYGIIYNKLMDPKFMFFKPESGTLANTIKINEGYAYDGSGQLIHQRLDAPTIDVFDADIWQWMIIEHETTNLEQGTVSIGGMNSSLMTGVGTEFTNLFRGQPNYPAKIKFTNSVNYTLEYEILEVLDDNNAIVQGVFDIVETGLQFVVVGTFTPGYQPTVDEVNPFIYDSCKVTLIQEIGLNTPPNIIINKQFIVARIENSTANGMIIQDKRQLNILKSTLESQLNNITDINPVIGLQSVKKFVNRTQTFFVVDFDWKFNISAETRNYQSNLVSVSAGSGGVYKTAADFTSGSFDNWRYYYEDGTFNTIIRSVKNGGNIDVYLDELKEDVIGLYITPDCDSIEISVSIKAADTITELYKKHISFNNTFKTPSFIITDKEIFKPSGGQIFILTFKHKKLDQTNTESIFNVGDYYTEEAFTAGVLTDNTKTLNDSSPTIGITL
jgi:hypothetical protein